MTVIYSSKVEREALEPFRKNSFANLKTTSSSTDEVSLKAEEKRILRKIDIRLVPYACLLYFLANLDRSNVGQAQVDGLEKDLHLNSEQYSISLQNFYIPYILFELVTLLLLRRLQPRLWLPTITIAWSIATVLMGLSKDFAGFATARWFIGLFESGLFPSLNLLISSYYTLHHVNLRIGFFIGAASLSAAFGGLLASGILQMRGVAHQHGWQWLFYIEGIITILCAIPGYWIIPNFADQESRSFLTPQEKAIWNEKLVSEQGSLKRFIPFSWAQVANVFKDWKTYCFALMYLSISVVAQGYNLFLPVIVKGLGFKGIRVNLLSVPPNVISFIAVIIVAIYSDRWQIKGPLIIGLMSISLAGAVITLCEVPYGVAYFAVCLTIAPLHAAVAVLITWLSSNSGPPYSKATTMGFAFTMANCSGLIASNTFRAEDAPRYIPGNSISLSFNALSIVCAMVLTLELKRLNRKRDAMTADDCNRLLEALSDKERAELGDRSPHFRYIV